MSTHRWDGIDPCRTRAGSAQRAGHLQRHTSHQVGEGRTTLYARARVLGCGHPSLRAERGHASVASQSAPGAADLTPMPPPRCLSCRCNPETPMFVTSQVCSAYARSAAGGDGCCDLLESYSTDPRRVRPRRKHPLSRQTSSRAPAASRGRWQRPRGIPPETHKRRRSLPSPHSCRSHPRTRMTFVT